jgi:dimethylamine corrinoid protein
LARDELFDKLADAVVVGDGDVALVLAKECVEKGLKPLAIIAEGLNEGMKRVGDLYEQQEYYVPEVLLSKDAMEAAFEYLRPYIKTEQAELSGTVVLGTVAGDVHSIGKNIVKLLLETGGFTVIDLGEDVTSEDFIRAAKEHKADVVGMSSLMTTTMLGMGETVENLKGQGLDVLTVIGGAPVNDTFRAKIGADGYAEDAAKAVRVVENILRKKREAK